MPKLQIYNGTEWVEIAKNGKDAVVNYDYILSQIPKPKDGRDGKDGFIDEATIGYLENEIGKLAKVTAKINSEKSDGIGLVVRELRAGAGVTIDNSNQEYPIITSTEGVTTWSYYATTWTVEPTLNSSIAGGDVYDYTLDGVTRYRFVPTTYDATQDAFYTTFSAGVLSGLIVTRG